MEPLETGKSENIGEIRENGRGIGKTDTVTWGGLLAAGREALKNAGIAEYSLDAWYLFEHAFGISRTQYFMCSGGKADAAENAFKEYEEGILRRVQREPLQYILGTQEFMGLEFYVNQYTLIPRQDTETLVETVLAARKRKDTALLDMCTGSGCIAVSLAAHGGYTYIEAADISEEALKTAGQNAEKLLPGRKVISAENGRTQKESMVCRSGQETIRFRHSDMFSAFNPEEDKYDIIVSNPPYIPSGMIGELEPEVRDFEPRSALDGTADGLFFYKNLAEECGKFLKENGAVYFEIGHDQGEAVEALLKAHGFRDTRIIKDLAGKDRVVCGRWRTA